MPPHYDIILFENYRLAQNHKFDVLLTARLLSLAGKKVAILDYYNEDMRQSVEGIDLVHHHTAVPKELLDNRPNNVLDRILFRLNYFRIQDRFANSVINEVKDWSDQYYCGSYHIGMTSAWFSLKKTCYYWGLRSNRFKCDVRKLSEDKIGFFRIPLLRKRFLKNPYQKLFVSNQLIRNEFHSLGVPLSRMVIRPERVVEGDASISGSSLENIFTFLSIGCLRSSKRIDYVINSFLKLDSNDCRLLLIGKSEQNYESVIQPLYNGQDRITRINKNLDYHDFLDCFKRSHFVVFADMKINGTVTNGTLEEALISGRPVIVPNYSPYSELIDNFKVGIMYDPSKPGSLYNAMETAMTIGVEPFFDEIRRYLKTIEFKTVSEKLASDLFGIETKH